MNRNRGLCFSYVQGIFSNLLKTKLETGLYVVHAIYPNYMNGAYTLSISLSG
jgi:hypothetical protein